ncbi:thioesterase family protein [Blastococcus sp. TF02A-26]|uniref:acyl-CoA thioesterase n=1 Tax=Blastococcus sp. TF02A-26 TaxID=2250577 RepID=UPI002100B521|nr:thioesterase family protein [Blastococcus sp. TF02A-26]
MRWGDADAYGHVNHARALGPLEDARLAMAQGSPGTVAGREPDIILARLEVDYLRQLRYRVGERLCVRTRVLRLGTKSFTVRQELTQDGEVAIRADAVMVLFDFATDASRPLTEAERAYWSGFQA